MITKLTERSWLDSTNTRTLCAAFERANMEMRFVGGCVRDALLGIKVKDIDVATPAPPDVVMTLLGGAGIKVIPTGISHGTVTAVIGGQPFEITTLRKDTSCDGRRAQVEFTDDWKLDAARRDLTMNALYAKGDGEVIDYFNGIEHAKAGHILFIGDPDQRITEDFLRILRFFRFYAHYGKGRLDDKGMKACAKYATKLSQLSGERIQHEMLRLLAAPSPYDTLRYMIETKVLQQLLGFEPDLEPLHVLPDIEKITHVPPDPVLRLAAILRTDKKGMAKQLEFIIHRWKLSNAAQKRLQELVQPSVAFTIRDDEKTLKRCIRRTGSETFSDIARLQWAEEGMDYSDHAKPYQRMVNLAANWQPPIFPVTGADLLERGLKSGPALGKILIELEEYWENSDYKPGKKELLEQLKK